MSEVGLRSGEERRAIAERSRVLLVGQTPITLQAAAQFFRRVGFEVLERDRVSLADYRELYPSLVVVESPTCDETLRSLLGGGTPVIAVTPNREHARIHGLEVGADDAIHPSAEMIARAFHAMDRRGSRRAVSAGDIVIDTTAQTVTKGGHPIELTEYEFAVLAFLAQSPRRVFTHAEIYRAVWHEEFTRRHINTVYVRARRIREAIETNPRRPRHLVTVRGAGYRFDP